MIGHAIRIVLMKKFWASNSQEDQRDLRATVQDAKYHKDSKFHEAGVMAEQPNKRDPTKVAQLITEILISQEPSVDGTNEIHKNCLREAIMDTYPAARKDAARFTLQDLFETSQELDLNPGGNNHRSLSRNLRPLVNQRASTMTVTPTRTLRLRASTHMYCC